jgi:membrane protein implicated in regulation of membrane protease activity
MNEQRNARDAEPNGGRQDRPQVSIRQLVFILLLCITAIVLVVGLAEVMVGTFPILAYAVILPLILIMLVAVSAGLRYRIARRTLSRRSDAKRHRDSRDRGERKRESVPMAD